MVILQGASMMALAVLLPHPKKVATTKPLHIMSQIVKMVTNSFPWLFGYSANTSNC